MFKPNFGLKVTVLSQSMYKAASGLHEAGMLNAKNAVEGQPAIRSWAITLIYDQDSLNATHFITLFMVGFTMMLDETFFVHDFFGKFAVSI